MIELTEEQQRELEKAEPAKLRDPRADETYVLVRADLYEHGCGMVSDHATTELTAPRSARDGTTPLSTPTSSIANQNEPRRRRAGGLALQ